MRDGVDLPFDSNKPSYQYSKQRVFERLKKRHPVLAEVQCLSRSTAFK